MIKLIKKHPFIVGFCTLGILWIVGQIMVDMEQISNNVYIVCAYGTIGFLVISCMFGIAVHQPKYRKPGNIKDRILGIYFRVCNVLGMLGVIGTWVLVLIYRFRY